MSGLAAWPLSRPTGWAGCRAPWRGSGAGADPAGAARPRGTAPRARAEGLVEALVGQRDHHDVLERRGLPADGPRSPEAWVRRLPGRPGLAAGPVWFPRRLLRTAMERGPRDDAGARTAGDDGACGGRRGAAACNGRSAPTVGSRRPRPRAPIRRPRRAGGRGGRRRARRGRRARRPVPSAQAARRPSAPASAPAAGRRRERPPAGRGVGRAPTPAPAGSGRQPQALAGLHVPQPVRQQPPACGAGVNRATRRAITTSSHDEHPSFTSWPPCGLGYCPRSKGRQALVRVVVNDEREPLRMTQRRLKAGCLATACLLVPARPGLGATANAAKKAAARHHDERLDLGRAAGRQAGQALPQAVSERVKFKLAAGRLGRRRRRRRQGPRLDRQLVARQEGQRPGGLVFNKIAARRDLRRRRTRPTGSTISRRRPCSRSSAARCATGATSPARRSPARSTSSSARRPPARRTPSRSSSWARTVIADAAAQKASNGLVQQAVRSDPQAVGYVSLAVRRGAERRRRSRARRARCGTRSPAPTRARATSGW